MENDIKSKYHCDTCNYDCLYPAHWKQHIESEKHKNEGKRKPRSDKKFDPKCNVCDYTTTRTTNMKLHYLIHHATNSICVHRLRSSLCCPHQEPFDSWLLSNSLQLCHESLPISLDYAIPYLGTACDYFQELRVLGCYAFGKTVPHWV